MSNTSKLNASHSPSSKAFDIFFGERIKDLREKKGITPEEFARLLEVGESSLKDYEAGSKKESSN